MQLNAVSLYTNITESWNSIFLASVHSVELYFTAGRSNTVNGLLSAFHLLKLWCWETNTRANMHTHTYQIEGVQGGEQGLGRGCRLAVMGNEGGLWLHLTPWPLIPTVTEWSRWQPTKSSDTDAISANDAPNPQSKTNRGEDGRTACLEVST